MAQALLRYTHPQLRLKQQLFTSQTKAEPAKGKINHESRGMPDSVCRHRTKTLRS